MFSQNTEVRLVLVCATAQTNGFSASQNRRADYLSHGKKPFESEFVSFMQRSSVLTTVDGAEEKGYSKLNPLEEAASYPWP